MILNLAPIQPPKQTCSLTIVIAARNEAGNLNSLLISLEEVFQNLGYTLPVLLIDDGSTDNSQMVLNALSQKYTFLTVVYHGRGLGLTACLKTAVEQTNSDWLYLMPADLESKPQTDLPLLLDSCLEGVDAVAGWRQGRKDGKVLASTIANLTCRLTFGLKIHDMNWIKLIRRDFLTVLPLEKITHAYILPILSGLGGHIVEVPTLWHPRQSGQTKFRFSRLTPNAIRFWKLWWWFYLERPLTTRFSQENP